MPIDVRKLSGINRGTSPSAAHDNASNRSWGANQGTTDPKQALKQKFNEREINPSTAKDK